MEPLHAGRLRKLTAFLLLLLSITSYGFNEVGPVQAAGVTYSFDNAGAIGSTGPTQSQINTSYSGSNLSGQVFINTQGVQEWTVPTSGDYLVTAAGAAGGSNSSGAYTGGGGALLSTKMTLTQGTVLKIVVGQKGADNPANCSTSYCGAAGGGGTFIYESATSTYLIVAGGGGGGASIYYNLQTTKTMADGKANTTSGSTISTTSPCAVHSATGGTNGAGGSASSRTNTNMAGPGAGINSDGGAAGGAEGKSRANGWLGGVMTKAPALPGGFGGGGGAGSWSSGNYSWAGGGGGYSGGGGGYNAGCGDGQYGGGGGSYFTGTLNSSANGANTGHGYATFALLSLPVISLALPNSITYRVAVTITATSDTSGRITFLANGKPIPRCIKVNLSGSATSYTASCSWQSSARGIMNLSAFYYAPESMQVLVRTSTTTQVVNRKTVR